MNTQSFVHLKTDGAATVSTCEQLDRQTIQPCYCISLKLNKKWLSVKSLG